MTKGPISDERLIELSRVYLRTSTTLIFISSLIRHYLYMSRLLSIRELMALGPH